MLISGSFKLFCNTVLRILGPPLAAVSETPIRLNKLAISVFLMEEYCPRKNDSLLTRIVPGFVNSK